MHTPLELEPPPGSRLLPVPYHEAKSIVIDTPTDLHAWWVRADFIREVDTRRSLPQHAGLRRRLIGRGLCDLATLGSVADLGIADALDPESNLSTVCQRPTADGSE